MEKNNKIIIVMLLLGVFLIGLITAQVIADRRQVTLNLNETVRDILATKNITDPTYDDLGCTEDRCYFFMYQDLGNDETHNLGKQSISARECINSTEGNFSLGETTDVCIEYLYYSNATLRTMQDAKMDEVMNDYAGVIKMRDERERVQKLDDGDVDIGNGGR